MLNGDANGNGMERAVAMDDDDIAILVMDNINIQYCPATRKFDARVGAATVESFCATQMPIFDNITHPFYTQLPRKGSAGERVNVLRIFVWYYLQL